MGDTETFRESYRLKCFYPQNWGTIKEYSCPTENQFYNPESILAFCVEELALQWILSHGSYFVLGFSSEIAF